MDFITATHVPEERRLDLTAKVFGLHFPLAIEPAIFTFADRLSPEYNGGYWDFYELSNCGFFMAPDDDNYTVTSDNGWQGTMTGEAFGICCCLYGYSNLSSSQRDDLAELCSRHYHLLREYMFEHAEVRVILAATD